MDISDRDQNQIERMIRLVFEEQSFTQADLVLPPIQELFDSRSEQPIQIAFITDLRKAKQVTACGHTDRKHYAKGLCSTCYHRYGRQKMAYNCQHVDRQLYAKGKCQFCYLKNYYKSKTRYG